MPIFGYRLKLGAVGKEDGRWLIKMDLVVVGCSILLPQGPWWRGGGKKGLGETQEERHGQPQKE